MARKHLSKSGMCVNALFIVAPLIVILAFVTRTLLHVLPRVEVPPHQANQPVLYIPKLIPNDIAVQLRELIKSMREFPTNIAADLKTGGYRVVHEHIGEASPIRPDGRCDGILVPSINNPSECVLPGRADVGKHFIMTGGVEGIKEDFDDMMSRVLSFARYMFDLNSYPFVKNLFESDDFQLAAKRVCPADEQYLDPFQFSFIIQVPGQTVALHLDGVYFWGATRFDYPQWLLAAMAYSNLFADIFVNQVQVVGYLHEWSPSQYKHTEIHPDDDAVADPLGGEFVYYLNNTFMGTVLPEPQSAISVDGSKTVHAAKIFHPARKAPHIDKDKDTNLVYVGNDRWELQVDGRAMQSYNTSELRQTIVYRARCFNSSETAQKFRDRIASKDPLPLDYILGKFINDLVARKKLSHNQKHTISRLDLANLIMDTYIKYPLPSKEVALFPYNYCAAKKLVPALAPLLSLICK